MDKHHNRNILMIVNVLQVVNGEKNPALLGGIFCYMVMFFQF